MTLNTGYVLALAFLPVTLIAMLLSGCSGVNNRLDKLEGSPVYEIGKLGFHMTVRSGGAELMIAYLDEHPGSADRLPQLSLAWDHLWTGKNPFDRAAFDAWLNKQADELKATEAERASLEEAGELLWKYLEVDAAGYVSVDDRSRRIVDSLVAGLRLGYRQWISQNYPEPKGVGG